VSDNTVTITIPNPLNPGQQLTLTITAAGGVTIPNNVQFYFWFVGGSFSSSGTSVRANNTSEYVGPFLANSITNASGVTTLDIDVNNLIKPDGTKGSVPAGSYKVKFADSETGEKYIGTTPEAISIAGTATGTGGGGGGGCNTGYGLIGLLFMGFAIRKYLTL
jgi:hypothetical protein